MSRLRWVIGIAIVALVGSAVAVGTGTISTAGAAEYSQTLCAGYSGCSVAPYTTHGYDFMTNGQRPYWYMTPGNECTNYAAYVEQTVYGVPAPTYSLSNATSWAANARAHGVPVDQTPTVGSVAQWNDWDSPIGHVAVVEQVGPNDSYVVVSEQNMSGAPDDYAWVKVPRGTVNGQPWPDNFIHFAGTTAPAPAPAPSPAPAPQPAVNPFWAFLERLFQMWTGQG